MGLAPMMEMLSHQIKSLVLSLLREPIHLVLPPGLAPRLRPHLGLNRYKLFVLLYTMEAKMVRSVGLAPTLDFIRQVKSLFQSLLWTRTLVARLGTAPSFAA